MPRMLEGLPIELDDEDVEVREEGTACHWAAHGLSQGHAVVEGMTAPNGVEIDDEMLDACAMWLGEVRSWGPDVIPLFEHPVHCRRIHQECGGVTDACGYSPSQRTVFIGDLKYGFRFVDVHDNWQLICYFAGVLDQFGLSDMDTFVEFVIVQPRSYHREGPIRRVRMRSFDVRAQINQLRAAAEHALGVPDANSIHGVPTLTVNDGCSRCSARHRCSAVQNAALQVLDDAYAATPHDLSFAAAEDELRRLQWAKSILTARITGLETQVAHEMRRGAISKHFALDAKAGREVWKEGMVEQASTAAQLMGISITKPQSYITPTQAKQKLPRSVVEMYSYRPSGSLKLVPFGDNMKRRLFGRKP